MSLISHHDIHPGAIVHVDRFPYEEDPTQGKPRYVLVIATNGNSVIVRGIYTQPRRHRQVIRATYETGLDHDSYLDARLVELRTHRINQYIGEAPYDYDPFNDFIA